MSTWTFNVDNISYGMYSLFRYDNRDYYAQHIDKHTLMIIILSHSPWTEYRFDVRGAGRCWYYSQNFVGHINDVRHRTGGSYREFPSILEHRNLIECAISSFVDRIYI